MVAVEQAVSAHGEGRSASSLQLGGLPDGQGAIVRTSSHPGDCRWGRPQGDLVTIGLAQAGDVLVVRVRGDLDLATGAGFAERVTAGIEAAGVRLPAGAVVFDLAGVTFLACAGVTALRSAALRLLRTGTPCYLLAAPPEPAVTVLRIVGPPPELPEAPPGLLDRAGAAPGQLVAGPLTAHTDLDGDGRRVAVVQGEIDMVTEPAFASLLDGLLEQASPTTVVDLSGVDHLSAAGARMLAQLREQLAARGAELLVLAPGPGPARVLDALRVPVHDDGGGTSAGVAGGRAGGRPSR